MATFTSASAVAGVNVTLSIKRSAAVTINMSKSVPTGVGCVGVAVGVDGAVPRQLGLHRATMVASGFDGQVGQTLVRPQPDGPTLVAVGIGDPAELDASSLRDAAAAYARAAGTHAQLVTTLADVASVPPEVAGQAIVEGVLLTRYRYDAFKQEAPGPTLTALTLVAAPERIEAVTQGAERGRITAAAQLGCGGLLGVNAGSVEPPRMIKLRYRPKHASGEPATATGDLALVGKGITYDSGGINLKPGDAMHGLMKMDMSGAAAVLAVEEHPDAIVNIATLTGACLRALGDQIAGVFGNHQPFVDQVAAAARHTDEPVWQLPLDQRYRKQIDSTIADLKNMGGEHPGAIAAALFLAEFVGNVPWARLDICGTKYADADESWRPKGATGFGTRLLVDLALSFTPPAS